MTRVHVFCEGQTEDVFVREVLSDYFAEKGIWLNPLIVRTGSRGKGGISTYGKIRWQIEKKCREDVRSRITTMFDFYGLPKDFPGMRECAGNSFVRAQSVQTAFQSDIGQPNFLANIVVHEFEALLFSETSVFGRWFSDSGVVTRLQAIRSCFPTPEHIDDGKRSAPSKRILEICREYDKILHGSLIAMDIGLERIRRACPRFNAWIERIEKWSGDSI